MATTAANVRVAVTGGAYQGITGTVLPTTATGALAVGFEELGYVSEDGITQTIDEDTEKIRAWQNGDTVREVSTTHDLMYELSMIETSAKTLETYYGNHVVATGAGTTEIRAGQGTRGVWAFHIIDGTQLIRIVVPDGQITEHGEVSYVNGEAIMYPITLTCYPDATGVKAYLYTAVAP